MIRAEGLMLMFLAIGFNASAQQPDESPKVAFTFRSAPAQCTNVSYKELDTLIAKDAGGTTPNTVQLAPKLYEFTCKCLSGDSVSQPTLVGEVTSYNFNCRALPVSASRLAPKTGSSLGHSKSLPSSSRTQEATTSSVISIGQQGGQTAGTIINYPPGKPPSDPLKISFSNSPLLTEVVRNRIIEDLTAFRLFLVSLRLDIPTSVPPISVGSPSVLTLPLELTIANAEDMTVMAPSGGRYEARTYPGHKPSTDFNQNLVLMPNEVSDRKAIIEIYCMYALGQVIDRISPDDDQFFSQSRSGAMMDGAAYFSASFLGARNPHWPRPSDTIWKIHDRLGKQYTDLLMAYTIRAFSESVYLKIKAPYELYLYNRIKDAAMLMDDTGAINTVTTIWSGDGLPTK